MKILEGIKKSNREQLGYNENKEDVFRKLLEAREKRVNSIGILSDNYKKSVICIRANYPGLHKSNNETIEIVTKLQNEVEEVFNDAIVYSFYDITYEGPITLLVVDAPSKKVKKETVKIEENHPLGRLVDIDVYDENGVGIGREEIEVHKRKCFLCENEAHVCVRSKAHGLEEIKQYINKTLQESIENGS